MCGCDYAKSVEELLDHFRVEQNRLSADSLFAAISVLRGKAHAHHDDRSKDMTPQQYEALREITNKVRDAHMEKIATLNETLSSYYVHSLDTDNLNDTDCRSALAVARDLVEKYRAAYEAELAVQPYRVLQLHMANETCDVKYADVKESTFCKKKLTNIAALEKLTESAISQFASLKAKCESLAEELRIASANNSSPSDATLASELESRIAELTRLCSVKDDETEAVRTKLRCSICEERDKNTAFACGHTLCGECATACGKCPLRCESERRGKPVKHSFRLYL